MYHSDKILLFLTHWRVTRGQGSQLDNTDYNPVWLDTSTSFNGQGNNSAYIARVDWFPDGSVYAQVNL